MPSRSSRPHSMLRLFLGYYLPPALLFLVLAGLFTNYSWDRHIAELSREERITLAPGAKEIERVLVRRISELHNLVQLSSMVAYLDTPTDANRSRVTEDLVLFARTSKIYNQITCLDTTGQERIRVNQTPDGTYAVPDSELQSRADRYYFHELRNLLYGQIYLSPFDLKISKGTVEVPHIPVLRLATPLFDSTSNKKGSLLIYYLGEDLLRRIATSSAHTHSLHYLLNSDGYWLNAPDSSVTWGFMRNRPDLTMAQRHPAAWQRIRTTEVGQFQDRDGLWTFTTATPLSSPVSNASVEQMTWKLVYHIPTAELDAAFRKLAWPVLITTLLVLLMTAGGAWRLARAHYLRRQMERSAREQLHRIDLLLNSTAEGIYAVDLQGSCIIANQSCAQLLGYDDPSELLNRQMHDLMHHTHPDGTPYPASVCKAHQAIEFGTKTTVEDELFWRKDGTPLPVSYTALPVRDDNGIVGMVCVFRDITERLKSDHERLRLLRLLEESLNEIYLFSTDTFRFLYLNRSALTNIGYSMDEMRELTAFDIKPLISESAFRTMLQPLLEGENHKLEFQTVHQRKDGSEYPVEVHLQLIHSEHESCFLAVIFDISERLCLEEQLRHAQKLESIGQLSSGIAHDFNNILQIISGNAQMLQLLNRAEGREQPGQLTDIMTAVERGTKLTGSMLAFARRQSISLRQRDLNQLVRESELLANRLLQNGQQLQLALHDRALVITCDTTLLQQVLFNLITNARDAMPDGGIITISTGVRDYSQADVRQHGLGEPGSYALLQISDTGQGISTEIRQKIFEPFFTTKEVGKGTGLGLSMIYGTIKQHNGFILLDSQPGAGTTFSIFLPLAPEQTDLP